jgi:hypothetical protein
MLAFLPYSEPAFVDNFFKEQASFKKEADLSVKRSAKIYSLA